MTSEMKSFFESGTKRTTHAGYTIHYTDSPDFPTHAVVEDGDGNMELVDIGEDAEWDDFEDFLSLVVEKYEG